MTREWAVTVFNRGMTGRPPPGVTALRGDRTVAGDLAGLAGHRWDVVIDTWDGPSQAVADSARLLADAADHYIYVSTRSVYRAPLVSGMTEDAPVVSTAVESGYGEMKAAGELAALRYFGAERTLVARTGLVLGPHEDVGRLPWWLTRIARGGDVLAPGPRDLPLQFVDARDLAAWLLDTVGLAGTFNALSRPAHTTTAELLAECVRATGSSARLRWVDPEPILAAGVRPWTDLPIWVPPGHPFRPMHETNTDRAHAAGLRCRPVRQTVADTWQWMRSAGVRSDIGLADEVAAAVLAGT